jgi:hypothetical protein
LGNKAAEGLPIAWLRSGIGEKGLNCAQGHFGKVPEGIRIEAVETPIDIEAMENGQTERDRGIGG